MTFLRDIRASISPQRRYNSRPYKFQVISSTRLLVLPPRPTASEPLILSHFILFHFTSFIIHNELLELSKRNKRQRRSLPRESQNSSLPQIPNQDLIRSVTAGVGEILGHGRTKALSPMKPSFAVQFW
jgi:hypothetical protein